MNDGVVAVEGYFGRSSYEPGDEVALHCGATVARPSGRVRPADGSLPFELEVARLGAEREVVHRVVDLIAEAHPIPADAAERGADWPVTLTFPAGQWRSGWYEALLRATLPDGDTVERRAGFVLRPSAGRPTAPILLQLSLNTWNAYNDWGRSNLYLGATAVSFRRPTAHGFLARPGAAQHRIANTATEPDLGGDAWLAHAKANGISSWSACAGWPTWEGPFVEWAERNGYRFDVAANADLEFGAELVAPYRLLLSVGHDEYWSAPMRDTVEAYIGRGGNVAFLSGNTSFWQVRLDDGRDTMVGFKDRARREDPVRREHPELMTGMWSDPVIGRPETAMTGVSFTRGGYARQAGCTPRGQRGYSVWRPEHWVFAGTDLRYGDLLGAEHCVVGYECDGCELTLENGLPVATGTGGTPPGFEVLATAPARLYSVDLEAGVNEYPTGLQAMRTVGELQGVASVLFGDASPANVARLAHGHAVLGTYQAGETGGTVVTTGCTDWAYGLAGADPIVERVTGNILDRLSAAADGAGVSAHSEQSAQQMQ